MFEKKLKNYTDSELFTLWKNNNDKNVLSKIGKELVKRNYMFTKEEFNAINYHLSRSKMSDTGFCICQKDYGADYFYDEEEQKNYTLQVGLQIVYESIGDISDYPIKYKNGLKKVMKRFLGNNMKGRD